MWSRVAPHLPVVVIDTGFLFDETHAYIELLKQRLGLTIEYARPAVPRDEFLWEHGADVMARDPDFCCARNKVAPLQPYIARALAWVSGLRRDQAPPGSICRSCSPRDDGPIKVHPSRR